MNLNIVWNGPYSWPGYENENLLSPLPNLAGVYLQTFEYRDGYLIYAAGLTRRPVSQRFREHTKCYMNGEYTVLDYDSAQKGIRKEIWHGWGYARDHRDEFENQKSEILESVIVQLEGFRIFIADLGKEKESRIHERVEASVMNNLYRSSPPICDFPDKGMQLSPQQESEEPILVKNNCDGLLHGLPEHMKI